MHSLPSRRRLPQPSFFRFKCYRLSPVPLPRLSPPPPPPPPPPAAASPVAISGSLPPAAAARLPLTAPPSVPAGARALAPPAGAARRQAWLRPPAQTQHAPGPERQADARLRAAVRRQGSGTVPQSSNRRSVTAPGAKPRPQNKATPPSSSHSPALSCSPASESDCGQSGRRTDARRFSVDV